MELLNINGLSFAYNNCEKNVLENISLSIQKGEFVVLCGLSGSGKSTLLRLIKKEISPKGRSSGTVTFEGKDVSALSAKESARYCGYVMQNPESQTVTDSVWHELAFGLESLCSDQYDMKLAVAETATFFGLDKLFRSSSSTLSGGQKQLLNLASAVTCAPQMLLLDEPVSQLDPITAQEFLNTVYKLNKDTAMTVVIAEHRLTPLHLKADKIAVLRNGRLIAFDTPRNVCEQLDGCDELKAFPTCVRLWKELNSSVNDCPFSVNEAKKLLHDNYLHKTLQEPTYPHSDTTALTMKNVWFSYQKNSSDVLRGVDLTVYRGEIFCILGGNGSGKTTLLKTAAGLLKPKRGKISAFENDISKKSNKELYVNNIAYLPQNVMSVFLHDTVREDLLCMLNKANGQSIEEIAARLDITDVLDRHPYDLSGGEIQKCAIAKLMLSAPRILLMDEPVKGMDKRSKDELTKILTDLKNNGTTIVIVTHDTEFAAETATKCAMFFDGEIICPASPKRFFSSNKYFTTEARMIAENTINGAVTVSDVAQNAIRKE